MTDQEVENGNKQIAKHNKFCLMKKPLPLYKKRVPLIVPMMYALIGLSLCMVPQFFFSGQTGTIWGCGAQCEISTMNNQKT